MTALESSVDNLTTEHTALTNKLAEIDQQYRVERPVIVGQLNQLARSLSALTGKPVAGPSGNVGRKPMSEAGKAAIKTGLERARASKQSTMFQEDEGRRTVGFCLWCNQDFSSASEVEAHNADDMQKCVAFQGFKNDNRGL